MCVHRFVMVVCCRDVIWLGSPMLLRKSEYLILIVFNDSQRKMNSLDAFALQVPCEKSEEQKSVMMVVALRTSICCMPERERERNTVRKQDPIRLLWMTNGLHSICLDIGNCWTAAEQAHCPLGLFGCRRHRPNEKWLAFHPFTMAALICTCSVAVQSAPKKVLNTFASFLQALKNANELHIALVSRTHCSHWTASEDFGAHVVACGSGIFCFWFNVTQEEHQNNIN